MKFLINFFLLFLYLKKIALPTAPTDVIISEVAATSVRLEWSYKGPEDLQYYVIQYKPKNANQVGWNKPLVNEEFYSFVEIELLCWYSIDSNYVQLHFFFFIQIMIEITFCRFYQFDLLQGNFALEMLKRIDLFMKHKKH